MGLNDLGTVMEHNLPIKIAIMNDSRQQMVFCTQTFNFGRQTATRMVNPDFVQLARAYGIETLSCSSVDDLPHAVARFVAATGPILVDFRVVGDICLPMVGPGKGLDEMLLPGS